MLGCTWYTVLRTIMYLPINFVPPEHFLTCRPYETLLAVTRLFQWRHCYYNHGTCVSGTPKFNIRFCSSVREYLSMESPGSGAGASLFSTKLLPDGSSMTCGKQAVKTEEDWFGKGLITELPTTLYGVDTSKQSFKRLMKLSNFAATSGYNSWGRKQWREREGGKGEGGGEKGWK